jgi:signal transduction histidine kinase
VGDSGPGFTGQSAGPPRKGIGLTNTRERLFQLYGAEHQIEIGRAADGGGVVVISIPFQELPQAAALP